ncbi:MAG TPA: FAD binding domain-containing protein, partial [Methylomirabilota bacterium]|nr:FAD binding domain-containing protein [Methylomirabilota bacterium]
MLRPFTLDRPSTLDEVTDLLSAHPSESVLYAGGTELLLLMKEGLIRPRRLIDVKAVRDLEAITAEDGTLTIGATVRHRGVERSALVQERCPLVAGVARHVANVRVRNVGTVGGNLAFADPHSDLATLFLALDATLGLWSRRGTRDIALADFIRGPYE